LQDPTKFSQNGIFGIWQPCLGAILKSASDLRNATSSWRTLSPKKTKSICLWRTALRKQVPFLRGCPQGWVASRFHIFSHFPHFTAESHSHSPKQMPLFNDMSLPPGVNLDPRGKICPLGELFTPSITSRG
jgi:hypothetical protein